MRKIVEDRGGVLTIRTRPDDAVARLRQLRGPIQERLAGGQPLALTNAERDLLLVGIAQTLKLL